MAFLRHWISQLVDKPTFLLISAVWNGFSIYVPLHFHWAAETVVFLNVVGNAVLVWLSLESEANVKND